MLLTRGRGSAESESEPMENTYTSLHAVNTEAPTGVREEVVPVAEDAEITDNDTMWIWKHAGAKPSSETNNWSIVSEW